MLMNNLENSIPAQQLGIVDANLYQKRRSQSKNDHYPSERQNPEFNLAQNQANIMQNLQKIKYVGEKK